MNPMIHTVSDVHTTAHNWQPLDIQQQLHQLLIDTIAVVDNTFGMDWLQQQQRKQQPLQLLVVRVDDVHGDSDAVVVVVIVIGLMMMTVVVVASQLPVIDVDDRSSGDQRHEIQSLHTVVVVAVVVAMGTDDCHVDSVNAVNCVDCCYHEISKMSD